MKPPDNGYPVCSRKMEVYCTTRDSLDGILPRLDLGEYLKENAQCSHCCGQNRECRDYTVDGMGFHNSGGW